jgi:hypothetical protein
VRSELTMILWSADFSWGLLTAGAVGPDQVSLGVLVSAVPRDVIDPAVDACGVAAKRSDGKLPPYVVAI